ncbi:hypothetical protein M514_24704 [Trichuris suis]|uniref:Uncharacterized protein n=1 Tax=Trichuris suis TaxID=68888 RepID=A0A085LLD6_9BILA|nr:hypothetical protein M513_13338 [Trichuris suis]KFD47192.1 hypothetical protein M513_11899 [Trichuris suis]KFD63117.1 hypothetical protein M514_24704 [Trichuris suis]
MVHIKEHVTPSITTFAFGSRSSSGDVIGYRKIQISKHSNGKSILDESNAQDPTAMLAERQKRLAAEECTYQNLKFWKGL